MAEGDSSWWPCGLGSQEHLHWGWRSSSTPTEYEKLPAFRRGTPCLPNAKGHWSSWHVPPCPWLQKRNGLKGYPVFHSSALKQKTAFATGIQLSHTVFFNERLIRPHPCCSYFFNLFKYFWQAYLILVRFAFQRIYWFLTEGCSLSMLKLGFLIFFFIFFFF